VSEVELLKDGKISKNTPPLATGSMLAGCKTRLQNKESWKREGWEEKTCEFEISAD
jgi:hypothetical protein